MLPFASIIIYLLGIVGIIGVIKLSRLYTTGKSKISGLKKYVFLNKYSEQLGMQALLGKELRYLLLGLFNKETFFQKYSAIGILFYLLSIVFFDLCLFWGLNDTNSIDLLKVFTSKSLYPKSTCLIYIIIFIDIVALVIPAWLLLTKNTKNKALLIVDDLDRVSPDEMLDIIESLKLFLEDDKINEILQIAMIFEEKTLKSALSKKYADIIDNNKKERERVLCENMQKFFIAQLNLPPLDISECIEYTSSLLDYNYSVSTYETNEDVRNSTDGAIFPQTTYDIINVLNENRDDSTYNNQNSGNEIIVLTNDEKKAIIDSLKHIASSGNSTIHIGPRAIQSLIIKYKLGRKLLEYRGIYNVDPNVFIKIIAKKYFDKTTEIENEQINDKRIISMVLNEIK